ncbi:MAG: hypothetical protein ABJF10_28785 [Chthoniobacter sp.]|uniref:hypothetical protein n=1 Tax=Chthoniobacter sp. TaxID=2510640 RepID=UPI0032AC46FC
MNTKLTAFTMVALLAWCSMALAVDVFPGQPNIKGAYNKLLNAIGQLEKSKQGEAQKHIDLAIVDLAAAKTMLEQSTNNKGTYRPTAIKLCDEAKEVLSAAPPDVVKATEIANHALKEVTMAGKAGSHR